MEGIWCWELLLVMYFPSSEPQSPGKLRKFIHLSIPCLFKAGSQRNTKIKSEAQWVAFALATVWSWLSFPLLSQVYSSSMYNPNHSIEGR